jgi:hypothetical protein
MSIESLLRYFRPTASAAPAHSSDEYVPGEGYGPRTEHEHRASKALERAYERPAVSQEQIERAFITREPVSPEVFQRRMHEAMPQPTDPEAMLRALRALKDQHTMPFDPNAFESAITVAPNTLPPGEVEQHLTRGAERPELSPMMLDLEMDKARAAGADEENPIVRLLKMNKGLPALPRYGQ